MASSLSPAQQALANQVVVLQQRTTESVERCIQAANHVQQLRQAVGQMRDNARSVSAQSAIPEPAQQACNAALQSMAALKSAKDNLLEKRRQAEQRIAQQRLERQAWANRLLATQRALEELRSQKKAPAPDSGQGSQETIPSTKD